ncbi:hypothetical protein M758_UG224600 [Ceratodon purpureus]|nr:hypothetical protein M758_UG224600 [Ceratodon purpureus]
MLAASYVGAIEAETVFDRVTHIIVYHKAGQKIPAKNILRSLGGQAEQDMLKLSQFLSPRGEKIKVVYHDWLDACLNAKKILPEAEYEAIT